MILEKYYLTKKFIENINTKEFLKLYASTRNLKMPSHNFLFYT